MTFATGIHQNKISAQRQKKPSLLINYSIHNVYYQSNIFLDKKKKSKQVL